MPPLKVEKDAGASSVEAGCSGEPGVPCTIPISECQVCNGAEGHGPLANGGSGPGSQAHGSSRGVSGVSSPASVLSAGE